MSYQASKRHEGTLQCILLQETNQSGKVVYDSNYIAFWEGQTVETAQRRVSQGSGHGVKEDEVKYRVL